jgi:hypothetical protein
MPRHTNRTPVRAQYAGTLRQAERDRRRKRLAERKRHPNRNVNVSTYRELSDDQRS